MSIQYRPGSGEPTPTDHGPARCRPCSRAGGVGLWTWVQVTGVAAPGFTLVSRVPRSLEVCQDGLHALRGTLLPSSVLLSRLRLAGREMLPCGPVAWGCGGSLRSSRVTHPPERRSGGRPSSRTAVCPQGWGAPSGPCPDPLTPADLAVNFEALIITLSVVGGAVLLAVAVCCACCCCRGKRSRKPDKSEERAAREREERRIRQEERCGPGRPACEAAAGVAVGPSSLQLWGARGPHAGVVVQRVGSCPPGPPRVGQRPSTRPSACAWGGPLAASTPRPRSLLGERVGGGHGPGRCGRCGGSLGLA